MSSEGSALPNVHPLPIVGLCSAGNQVVPGILISVLPWGRARFLPRENTTVVLFDVGLGDACSEAAGEGSGGLLAQLPPEQQANARTSNLAAMKGVLAQLAEAGVGIVASQRVIHAELCEYCLSLGMLPWQR